LGSPAGGGGEVTQEAAGVVGGDDGQAADASVRHPLGSRPARLIGKTDDRRLGDELADRTPAQVFRERGLDQVGAGDYADQTSAAIQDRVALMGVLAQR